MIDICCGIGGLTSGFVRAGAVPILAIDNDIEAAGVYRLNHPSATVLHKDILRLDPWQLSREFQGVDLVIGGLPANPYTLLANQGSRLVWGKPQLDQRRHIIGKALNFIDAFQPRAFCFANVWRALSSPEWERVVRRARERGFSVAVWKLRADRFGVPQRRRVGLLVGTRGHLPPPKPARSSAIATPEQVFADLPLPTPESIDVLHRPFKRLSRTLVDRALAARYGGRTGLRDGRGRTDRHHAIVKPDKPAAVLTSQTRPIHWSCERYLTAREIARLQQVPDDYQFGSLTNHRIRALLGMTFPVLLAQQLAETIMSVIQKAADDLVGALGDVLDMAIDSSPDGISEAIAASFVNAVWARSEGDESFVLGVVAEPSEERPPAIIRSMAHKFMKDYRQLMPEYDAGILVVESFLAPPGLSIHGRTVVAGSWILGVKVTDRLIWKQILDGEFTGGGGWR